MASFTTLNLSNERVLVKGTDSFGTEGQTVLSATEWFEIKRHQGYTVAAQTFDNEVEAFFAPLLEAAEKAEAARAMPAPDPVSFIVLHEGTEGVEAKADTVVYLGRDSIVLRLIESGDTDRLIWVDGELEVLEILDGTQPAPSVTSQPEAHEDTQI